MSLRKPPEFMAPGEKPPPCFTQEQWDDWRKACRHKMIHQQPPRSICEDCTPKHKYEMLMQGRCTHPESIFVRKGGALIGVLPTPTTPTTTPQEEPAPCNP